MATAKYRVAVTGLNAAENPCPGIGVIRSLRQAFGKKIHIIGLTYELLDSAAYLESLVDEVYSMPFPTDDEDKYLLRMREIVKKTKIHVLIPNLDFEIPVLSNLETDLRGMGIRLLLPSEATLDLCKKEKLSRIGELAEVYVPFTIVLRDRREVVASAAYFTYPFIIKAATGEACLVYTLEEAIVFANRLASHWGWPLIMQQYIRGDEFCVAALANSHHDLLGAVCMKKILKSKNGTAWIGNTIKEDALIKITKKMVKKAKWKGPLEVEFIKDQDYRRYFLIEINPRFPTWIELVAQAGCNLPMALVKTALSGKVKPFTDYQSGILFARSCMDITCDVARLGQLAVKEEIIYYEQEQSQH
ncbi:MAG: ATP-grasp domain-containing protein [Candidatus Omnitrophica bacterium]|nr:ATP-grasp domain-containing protein [Candidatus Omnitrophota bacterium]